MGSIDLIRTYNAKSDERAELAALLGGEKTPAVFLVDRIWPRGIAKADLPHDVWLKDAAPSTELRKWFGHDPDKFDEFGRRYRAELDKSDAARELITAAKDRDIVLLYSAKDEEHNQAVVLRSWINSKR